MNFELTGNSKLPAGADGSLFHKKQLEGSQVLFSMEAEDCDRCYMLMNYNEKDNKAHCEHADVYATKHCTSQPVASQ